jgi:hypothetical protein
MSELKYEELRHFVVTISRALNPASDFPVYVQLIERYLPSATILEALFSDNQSIMYSSECGFDANRYGTEKSRVPVSQSCSYDFR